MLKNNFFLAPPTNCHSIKNFLAKQEIIRACMTNGANFGDQSCTINIMNRLRQLGFKGKFEVIYDDEWTKATVTTLFGIPKDIPDVYEDKINKIDFIELKTQEKRVSDKTLPLVDLGFSAGDNLLKCSCDNAYTKTFLQFSPFADHDTSIRTFNPDATKDISDEDETEQKGSGEKHFIYPVPSYIDTKHYLENTPGGQTLLRQKPGLKCFMEGMEKQAFNVMPIYGRTLRFSSTGTDGYAISTSPSKILQTIAGARYAQIVGKDNLQKPLIIAVYDDYQPYADELMRLIKQLNWGSYERSGVERIRQILNELKVADAISASDVSDPDAINIIKSLKDQQILLLSLGRLPKTLFDGLFSYYAENIWPHVVEGPNSMALAIAAGAPLFECAENAYWRDEYNSNWSIGFDLINDPELKEELTNFYDVTYGYAGGSYTNSPNLTEIERLSEIEPWDKNIHQSIGHFIIAASDPESAFSKYFRHLRDIHQQPENDRVCYALKEVIKLLENTQAVERQSLLRFARGY